MQQQSVNYDRLNYPQVLLVQLLEINAMARELFLPPPVSGGNESGMRPVDKITAYCAAIDQLETCLSPYLDDEYYKLATKFRDSCVRVALVGKVDQAFGFSREILRLLLIKAAEKDFLIRESSTEQEVETEDAGE